MSQPTLILRGRKEKLPFIEKLPILNTQVSGTVLGGEYNPFELRIALPHVIDRNRGLGKFAFLPIKLTIEKRIFNQTIFPTPMFFLLQHKPQGNGNPLQCSCLENPRDGGAWWAAVYGVIQSRTRLKRLSSSSSICENA